jgi:hypothetical protein
MVALDACVAVPVAFVWTLAFLGQFVEDLVGCASLAEVKHSVEVLFLWAGHALRAVEDRGLFWTGFALVDTQVVDVVLWA